MPRGKKEPKGDGLNSQGATEMIKSYVERFEALDKDAQAIAEDKKQLMAEAKGQGFDTKILRKVIALRKRKLADVAEEQAVLDLYMDALGMSLDGDDMV